MNRVNLCHIGLRGTVPRTRGDEPTINEMTAALNDCSPHARG